MWATLCVVGSRGRVLDNTRQYLALSLLITLVKERKPTSFSDAINVNPHSTAGRKIATVLPKAKIPGPYSQHHEQQIVKTLTLTLTLTLNKTTQSQKKNLTNHLYARQIVNGNLFYPNPKANRNSSQFTPIGIHFSAALKSS